MIRAILLVVLLAWPALSLNPIVENEDFTFYWWSDAHAVSVAPMIGQPALDEKPSAIHVKITPQTATNADAYRVTLRYRDGGELYERTQVVAVQTNGIAYAAFRVGDVQPVSISAVHVQWVSVRLK